METAQESYLALLCTSDCIVESQAKPEMRELLQNPNRPLVDLRSAGDPQHERLVTVDEQLRRLL